MKAVNDDVSAAAGYAALLIGWANAFHASRCPVAKSIEKAIEISTELTFA